MPTRRPCSRAVVASVLVLAQGCVGRITGTPGDADLADVRSADSARESATGDAAMRDDVPVTLDAARDDATIPADVATREDATIPMDVITPPDVATGVDAVVVTDGAPPGPSSTRNTARPLGSTSAPQGFWEYLPPGYDGRTPVPLLIALLHQDSLGGAACRPLGVPAFSAQLLAGWLAGYGRAPRKSRAR